LAKTVGILTGGGDCPGLNAVIRAVVRASDSAGWDTVAALEGWRGLVDGNFRDLGTQAVSGILPRGGTIIGTSRTNPFKLDGGVEKVLQNFSDRGLDALVAIGGEDTLGVAERLYREHQFPIVGVPKTIDNDIVGTTNCFGFDTAVAFATDAIDRLHTTAEAHRRIMVVEVMGRYAGWIALYAGVAGGADAILIPEIPFNLESVAERLIARDKWGAHFSIVVVAEGAFPRGGSLALVEGAHDGHVERLGGVGANVCEELSKLAGKETRSVVLGHLQRGGAPTSFDRVLATRFGAKAVELVMKGDFGTMVAFDPPDIIARRLEDVVGRTKTVPMDNDLLLAAKALGVTFGDEK
jgi:ATP-dependent phosphofructokinase / diphosphate-dependent phosphofructokinase